MYIKLFGNLEIKKQVTSMMNGRPWPTKADNEAAMDALLRLQYVYNFDLKEVSNLE